MLYDVSVGVFGAHGDAGEKGFEPAAEDEEATARGRKLILDVLFGDEFRLVESVTRHELPFQGPGTLEYARWAKLLAEAMRRMAEQLDDWAKHRAG